MHRSIIIAFAGLALAACDKPADDSAPQAPEKEAAEAKPAEAAKKADAHAAFTNLSPQDVDKMVADKGCVPVDANNPETRDKYGILPGAVLLSKSQGYDLGELPADKSTKLVFYCGGEKCTAAPKAAAVAVENGYRDVNVMRAGIRGWVDAGKKTDKPAS